MPDTAALNPGCPSGLAPPELATGTSSVADPSPFVQTTGTVRQLELTVRGAKCGGCLSKIEKAVGALPGVSLARLNLSTGEMRIAWSGDLAPARIVETVSDLGYGAAPIDRALTEDETKREERGLLMAMGIAGFATANIMLLSISVWSGAEMGEATRRLMHMISGAIALPAVILAGQPFFRSAWNVLKRGHANMDVPISLALILATGVSIWQTLEGGDHAYFDAAVMLLFFLLIGRFLDARLRRRAHSAAHDLAALRSRTATRLGANGRVEAVKAADIAPGDTLLIAAGERALVDLDIVSGMGAIDESLVTGESLPRSVGPGTRVYAGSVAVDQALTGRAVAAASDSLMADIAEMLEAGEQRRSTYRKIADKAVSLYVPLVHTTAFLTFIGWILAGPGIEHAIMVAVSTLIITCPCALALAAPVVQVVASGRLFKSGVFLKSGDALERLASAEHIVFDKTGTLTFGKPQLVSQDVSGDTLERAAQLARASRHPLSRAIVDHVGAGPLAEHVREHPGLGLEGEINGETCRLGSAEWVGVSVDAPSTTLWFSEDAADAIRLDFEDELRGTAADAIAALKTRGFSLEIVSGDTPTAVEQVANALGVETWSAGVKPAGKAERLETLRVQGKKALMIGDGLNDAGALSLAHAALAPGGAMDVSQSASDAVYRGGDLMAVVETIDAARRARSAMLQNFTLAALYNVIAIPIAVAGFATPLVAAIAMSASSLIVTLNALRQNY